MSNAWCVWLFGQEQRQELVKNATRAGKRMKQMHAVPSTGLVKVGIDLRKTTHGNEFARECKFAMVQAVATEFT
eukprot:6275983-Amphidinium_carterae.1